MKEALNFTAKKIQNVISITCLPEIEIEIGIVRVIENGNTSASRSRWQLPVVAVRTVPQIHRSTLWHAAKKSRKFIINRAGVGSENGTKTEPEDKTIPISDQISILQYLFFLFLFHLQFELLSWSQVQFIVLWVRCGCSNLFGQWNFVVLMPRVCIYLFWHNANFAAKLVNITTTKEVTLRTRLMSSCTRTSWRIRDALRCGPLRLEACPSAPFWSCSTLHAHRFLRLVHMPSN